MKALFYSFVICIAITVVCCMFYSALEVSAGIFSMEVIPYLFWSLIALGMASLLFRMAKEG